MVGDEERQAVTAIGVGGSKKCNGRELGESRR